MSKGHGHRQARASALRRARQYWGPPPTPLTTSVIPRFLLQKRSRRVHRPGSWSIPGGAIREGESPAKAAIREAIEETGPLPRHA